MKSGSGLAEGYTSGVLLILVVLVLSIIGVIRLAQTLEPRQRVVLVLVFVLTLVYLTLKLIQLGILGHRTDRDTGQRYGPRSDAPGATT
jgi:hypothetical protein